MPLPKSMKLDKYQNDRYRIVLLSHKPDRTSNEESELATLMAAYPENGKYLQDILMKLNDLGFIEVRGGSAGIDQDGNPIQPDPKEVKYVTNEKGILALQGFYESEIQEKSSAKSFKKAELAGIIVAALGGLITLLTFLYDLIKRFL